MREYLPSNSLRSNDRKYISHLIPLHACPPCNTTTVFLNQNNWVSGDRDAKKVSQYMVSITDQVSVTPASALLASNPGSLSWAERRAWYILPAHAPKFPEILGIRILSPYTSPCTEHKHYCNSTAICHAYWCLPSQIPSALTTSVLARLQSQLEREIKTRPSYW